MSQNNSFHDFYKFLAKKKSDIEAMNNKGTLARSKTKSHSANSMRVRKSQISFPLTRPDTESSLIHDPDLLHPYSTKKSHSFFSNTSAEDSGSSFSVNYPSDNESESDSSQITFQVPKIARRVSEHEPSTSTSKAANPIRKFSLPPESKLSPKDGPVPNIRISIEDADAETVVVGNSIHEDQSELTSAVDPTELETISPLGNESQATGESIYNDFREKSPEEVKLYQHEDKVMYVTNRIENINKMVMKENEDYPIVETINKLVQNPTSSLESDDLTHLITVIGENMTLEPCGSEPETLKQISKDAETPSSTTQIEEVVKELRDTEDQYPMPNEIFSENSGLLTSEHQTESYSSTEMVHQEELIACSGHPSSFQTPIESLACPEALFSLNSTEELLKPGIEEETHESSNPHHKEYNDTGTEKIDMEHIAETQEIPESIQPTTDSTNPEAEENRHSPIEFKIMLRQQKYDHQHQNNVDKRREDILQKHMQESYDE